MILNVILLYRMAFYGFVWPFMVLCCFYGILWPTIDLNGLESSFLAVIDPNSFVLLELKSEILRNFCLDFYKLHFALCINNNIYL